VRTALAISVIAHVLLWGPLAWVGREPLPTATQEIVVEIVPSDVLDETPKAQEPDKPNVPDVSMNKPNVPKVAMNQKAEPQSSLSPQRQDQPQQSQQAPRPDVPPAQSAQSASGPQAAQAEAEPDDSQPWGSWIDSPLMTASVGFDTVPSAAKLSEREIATFKARLQECWSPPADLADAQNLVVVLRVSLQPNGALTAEPTLLAASASPKGAELMQTAMRALRRCQPFGFLPAAKYKEWKRLDLSFSPTGLSAIPTF
jgi:hypothetical protein